MIEKKCDKEIEIELKKIAKSKAIHTGLIGLPSLMIGLLIIIIFDNAPQNITLKSSAGIVAFAIILILLGILFNVMSIVSIIEYKKHNGIEKNI